MAHARDAGVGSACDVIIAALEAELQKARELSARVRVDGDCEAFRRALRLFCAGLVETSVDLAGEFSELTASAQRSSSRDFA